MKRMIRSLTITVVAVLALCFMTAVSFADTEIPEGAPFTGVTCDVEGAVIKVADTGEKVSLDNYQGVEAPLYKISLPFEASIVHITAPREGMYFNPTYGNNLSGCTNKGNFMTSFNNAQYTDETITFPVDPSQFSTSDGYWAAPHRVNEWSSPAGPLFAFTFERLCEHSGEGVEITHMEAEEPTCTEGGIHEFWHCSKCARFYSDEAMTVETKREDIDIPALGHDFGEDCTCTRCRLRGDATVEFSGEKAEKITDESASRTSENAGIDFTFKVDNAFVAYNPLVTLDAIFTRDEHIVVYAGDITIKGVTVPNYKIYGVTTNLRLRGISDNIYYVMAYDSDGNSLPNGWNARYNDITAGEQYFAGKSNGNSAPRAIGETAEAYYGFIPCTGEPEIEYEELIPDENGVYTIPGEKLQLGSTVRVLVDKTASEKVEDIIAAIGEVTVENAAEKQEAITAAREAYDALSDDDKAKVDPASLSELTSAEQIAALAGTIDDQTTPEEKALIDAQIAAIKQTQEAIKALSDEVKALKESAKADDAKIADLESQLSDLQTQLVDLSESAAQIADLEAQVTSLQNAVQELGNAAATKAELEAKVEALNGKIAEYKAQNEALSQKITKLEQDLADVIGKAATNDELEALKKTIADLEKKLAEVEANTSNNGSGSSGNTNNNNVSPGGSESANAEEAAAKKLKVKGLKAKAKNGKFKVSWKKTDKASGYQVQYKLKTAKKWQNLKKSTTKVKVSSKKLKKGKTYSFRVRTYTKINGQKVFGVWTKAKNAKCK